MESALPLVTKTSLWGCLGFQGLNWVMLVLHQSYKRDGIIPNCKYGSLGPYQGR